MKSSVVALSLFAVLAGSTALARAQSTQPAAPKPDLLGPEFRSPSNGIALRPPAHCRKTSIPPSGAIAEFDDTDRAWALTVKRLSLPNPLPLSEYKDQYGTDHDGLLELTLTQLRKDPAAEVVTDEVIHSGPGAKIPVGMLVIRYEQNLQKRLLQQALIQANDQLYYVLELNTPARSGADTGVDDPGERLAADTFNALVDSVQLLDRSSIYEDQAQRLIRTRGLYANWTPSFLVSRLIPEQFFRLLRNGHDFGYLYQVEEVDDKAGRGPETAMIRVSIRSESPATAAAAASSPAANVSTQSRLVIGEDRRHEDWISLAIIDTPAPAAPDAAHAATPRETQVTELGVSDQKSRAVPLVRQGEGLQAAAQGDQGPDAIQPGLRLVDVRRLLVTRNTVDEAHPTIKHDLPPFTQDLPAFYLPRALGQLLPRLLTDLQPRGYLFAVYVPDGDNGGPAVMLRYVDVLPPAEIMLDGKSVVAIPVTDHVGLEGLVTTHYLNPDTGAYLGSMASVIDKDGATITDTILPTDAATLKTIWPNCNLTKPDRIVDVGSGR